MKNIIFILFFIVTSCTQSQSTTAIVNKADYPFWISLPENYNENKKLPLLFFLHGRSLSGTDMNRVKRYGVLRAMEKGRKIPGIVVAPQLASGAWDAKKLLDVLKYVKRNYNIDDDRVYVCGMSLGAYGTLEFAGKYPNKIAAAVAICGGGNESDACDLSKIPLWIQHGDADKAVNISESKKIVAAIKKCDNNSKLIFTTIKGGTHGSVEQIFHENAIYNWMFAQEK